MSTIWKPVAGFERYYEVSNDGRVRSFDRVCQNRRGDFYFPRACRGKEIYGTPNNKGYIRVRLCTETPPSVGKFVHTLVLDAFTGAALPGQQCRHLDGNPANNNIENLVWGTALENSQDKRRHGTEVHVHGEESANAKLTSAAVLEARKRYATEKISCVDLAKEFGIAHSALGRVLTGESWAHIAPTVEAPWAVIEAAKGTRHGMAKLTEDQVRWIRKTFADGTMNQAQIAKYLGVHNVTVSEIVLRKKWKNLD